MAFSFVYSQEATNVSVAEKLKTYSGKAYQEKLFLHTDREFYIAGEILWFKIYYVDGITHTPADLSKVAYVEILNEKNEAVLQSTNSLEPGESNGSFYLPTTLNTGNYSIRAYTNWMKNFDAGYFFEKKISVVNTLKISETVLSKDTISKVAINFFPEGGNLVNDIQSKVGFSVVGEDGSINNCRGFILNQNGDTITSFMPLKSGIGKFDFKPVKGSTYNGIIVLSNGTVINKKLPDASDDGFVLSISENEKNQLIVKVQRKSKPGDLTTEQCLLAAHTRQVLKVAEKITLNAAGITELIVDKNKIGTGITHFTLFDEQDTPVCERLFFVKTSIEFSLNISTDKKVYKNREKISLTVNEQIEQAKELSLNLSASVFKIDSLQKADEITIVSYLLLSSDLQGNIETPEYYFSNEPDVKTATDNLMLTHGWRRFKWDDVLITKEPFIKYLPEINGQLVSGKVTDKRNDKPIENVPAYLSVPGHPFGFYVSESDKNGTVQFEIKKYFGNRQVVSRPVNEADSFYRVEIFKPYSEIISGRKYGQLRLTENLKEILLQKSIGMQVQNIYAGDSIRNFKNYIPADTLPFYGTGETVYKLDNYKRFTTMEEVLREYVTGVNVGVKNGKLGLKIFNPADHEFYEGYALVMLDGVALTDQHKIFSYDPLKVNQLDVIANRYVVGQTVFNGIASFTTYDGVFDAFELDPKLVAIDYNGLQSQREFYSPSYATKEQLEQRIPDFRNTLFWAPNISTDKEGKATVQFYSSDRSGKYVVIVQGMSNNGDPVSAVTAFQVE